MTKRTRRTHAPAFKAKVVLAALRGDETLPGIGAALRCSPEPDPHLRSASLDTRQWRGREHTASRSGRLQRREAEASSVAYSRTPFFRIWQMARSLRQHSRAYQKGLEPQHTIQKAAGGAGLLGMLCLHHPTKSKHS